MLSLDPDEIFRRGHEDCVSLTPHERLVFLLLEFEGLMNMEGWDDFFTSRWSSYYPELEQGLLLAGDNESLAVLQDYETHLKAHGTSLDPSVLDAFLEGQSRDYFANCRDWREAYTRLSDRRWSKIRSYLESHGLSLLA
jgi:hypothetical protein